MKTDFMKYFTTILLSVFLGILLTGLAGCERDTAELPAASYPVIPEVFIDGFSKGLNYAAFGSSVPTAFDVDEEVFYNTTGASMRFEVPDSGDPLGAYAGGCFYTNVGRDLSGFNVLTFWAKASKSASLDVVGFGNDLGESRYQVTLSGLTVNTSWKKYYIPIPDPSRLTSERGMFFYSEGPEEEKGYTFWIDDLKFENLGTVAHPEFTIFDGENRSETSFIGISKTVTGVSAIFNLPTGINQAVNASTAYFTFSSSDNAIATVDPTGNIMVTGGPGSARITAKVGNTEAKGSLLIQSLGEFDFAPAPVQSPEDVISVFSDTYTNVPVNYYNGYWAPYQTTLSADFEVNGDHVLQYTNFNFVGIEFSSPTVDATAMTHLHLDLFIPVALTTDALFKIELVNQGGAASGTHSTVIPASQTNQWFGLDIPFSAFTGLPGTDKLMQIIFVNENTVMSVFYADNIYFYNDGTPPPPLTEPDIPAPTPTKPAAQVISVFSDAYTNIAGTDLNPNWGQATMVTQYALLGNNTMKYAGLNYQGIQLGSSQNVSGMSNLHLDFWTANSTALNVYIISPGPVETPYTLTVPTTGWSSVDIPLSAFAPVNLSDVIQLKFDGNGDIFLDNIYFSN